MYGGRHSDVGDSEFDIRSFLRRKDWFMASHSQCDSHVRLWISTYTPTQRKMWKCPACGVLLRQADRPRDADGKVKRHCGCRTGAHPRRGTSKYGIKADSKARWKQLARSMGLPGFKPSKHDAHVRAFKLNQSRISSELRTLAAKARAVERASRVDSSEERRRQFNACTKNLSDGYVSRLLKKNMPSLKGVKLPKDLIDLERLRLMIVREVKQRSKDEELQDVA